MYQLQENPDQNAQLKNGEVFHPVATLKDEHGGVAHIAVDDGCYVLCLERDDGCIWSTHWFKEVLGAVQSLPTNPRDSLRYDQTSGEMFPVAQHSG